MACSISWMYSLALTVVYSGSYCPYANKFGNRPCNYTMQTNFAERTLETGQTTWLTRTCNDNVSLSVHGINVWKGKGEGLSSERGGGRPGGDYAFASGRVYGAGALKMSCQPEELKSPACPHICNLRRRSHYWHQLMLENPDPEDLETFRRFEIIYELLF